MAHIHIHLAAPRKTRDASFNVLKDGTVTNFRSKYGRAAQVTGNGNEFSSLIEKAQVARKTMQMAEAGFNWNPPRTTPQEMASAKRLADETNRAFSEFASKMDIEMQKTKDASPELTVGAKVRLPSSVGKNITGTVKNINGNIASVAYKTEGGSNQQEDFHVTKLFNSAGQAFAPTKDAAEIRVGPSVRTSLGVEGKVVESQKVAGQQSAVVVETKEGKKYHSLINQLKTLDAVSEVEKGKMVAMLSHKMNIPSKVAREALVAEEWDYEEAVKDIRASNTKDSTFTGTESAWATKVKDKFPTATFRPRPIGKVSAKVGDKEVGYYNKDKGSGTIEDGVRDAGIITSGETSWIENYGNKMVVVKLYLINGKKGRAVQEQIGGTRGSTPMMKIKWEQDPFNNVSRSKHSV